MSPFLFSYPCPSCETEHPCSLSPPTPAPPCQDPSSLAYSDPGDPGDLEGPDRCVNCDEVFDQDDLYDEGIRKLEQAEADAADEAAEREYNYKREDY